MVSGTSDLGASSHGGRTVAARGLITVLAIVALAGACSTYWLTHRASEPAALVLHGTIDLRQIDLPFNGDERIAAVLVQEGDHVREGQLLARLDTSRLQAEVGQAKAQVTAQESAVDRLHQGSRPQEILQLRASFAAAEAEATNARRLYERQRRLMSLSGDRAVSQNDLDNAESALDVATANATAAKEVLALAVIGPRKADIARGEAQLNASQFHLALLERQLADAELLAPADAVVRARLMEPGEMASPQRPVLSLAIINPKWVRAYIPEPDLGKIQPGEAATIMVDSFPQHRFEGWIGFISPVAEFTPKTVETEALRTSLVYEVRVFVKDPGGLLPLGAPATVHLPPGLRRTR